MIIRKTEGWGIVEIYPLLDDMADLQRVWSERIEVFPKGFEMSLHSEKRVRHGGQLWTRIEWLEYNARLTEAMDQAFAIEDETK